MFPDQYEMDLISHSAGGEVVQLRKRDGYINATALCKAVKKQYHDYARLSTTVAFLEALSAETGIPVSELVQVVKGGVAGDPKFQGTWVHPDVAIHLGQWASPRFAVQVSRWVRDWMSGGGSGKLPYHLRRYVANRGRVPPGHFSVLQEMTMALIAPLEDAGYCMSEKLWPDISQGSMFARWLRDEKGLDTNAMPTYPHHFEDGRPAVQAKAYPNDLLADFRKHFDEVWLPQRAPSYFSTRDPAVLPYLPKLLPPKR